MTQREKFSIPREDYVLTIGDGDFSFSLALLKLGQEHIVATSYDSFSSVTRRYANAKKNIDVLRKNKVLVLHKIDATRNLSTQLQGKTFDRVVFQNPFSDPKINSTESLISSFLRGCVSILKDKGEVNITTKTAAGEKWKIHGLAPDGLEFIETREFGPRQFPGYNIVTTWGRSAKSMKAIFDHSQYRTWIFRRRRRNGRKHISSKSKAKTTAEDPALAVDRRIEKYFENADTKLNRYE